MSLDEQWPTPELIQAAVDRFTARMPGWTPTAAYGVAFVPTDDGIGWSFPVVNVGWLHRLPALALGIVTGRRTATGTYDLTPAALQCAVDLLAPAEPALMYRHPNLAAWRAVLGRIAAGQDGRIVVACVDSLDDEPSSPFDAVFRAQLARGGCSELHV